MTQTLVRVVVVHILIWDNKKSQINEYNDRNKSNGASFVRNYVQTQTKSLGFLSCVHSKMELNMDEKTHSEHVDHLANPQWYYQIHQIYKFRTKHEFCEHGQPINQNEIH